MTTTSPSAPRPQLRLVDEVPPRPFDVLDPLPQGTTLLEASAGTGKTYTIAALATRYVAEGHADLSELLLVTFGRAATSELRERVRERFVSAQRLLAREDCRDSTDRLVAHLAAVDDAELDRRRYRLGRALAEFDGATIATTHGFCQQMLTRLGVLADLDADAAMVGDVADLVTEVGQDVYLQRYATDERPMLSVEQVAEVARAAVGDRLAVLEPAAAHPDSFPGHRYIAARAAVREVARRMRERRLLDYDDLLVLLRDALVHPQLGGVAAQRIREHYRVVMVDEFQDTDPVQWQILRTAFHGERTLVLIGDPKQAVYAFRGGDVVAYLEAGRDATALATLATNWRSDAALLDALQHLMREAALGDERIVVRPVRAHHQGSRLVGAAPLRIRQVRRSALGLRDRQLPRVGDLRELIAADLAADVVTQLDRVRLGSRALQPGDIAVLTRKNSEATLVQQALVAAGVPAVVSGVVSVFSTRAARLWLTLLDALDHPGHAGRTAALALTELIGWGAAQLAGAGEPERDALSDRVRGWARLLASRGVGALLEAVTGTGLLERVATRPDGDRLLTDLRHVGQVLQEISVREQAGVSALAAHLRRRVAEAEADYAEERSRRLETDQAAVQVLTVHASKGLEFPVVYLPFAWDRFESDEVAILRFHDGQGRRILHVGGPASDHYDVALARHRTEERGEDLRLLYVALTRAASQVVTWWAPSHNSSGGALTRMLFGGHGPGEEPPPSVRLGSDDDVAAWLLELAAASGGALAAEVVSERPAPVRRPRPAAEPAPLELATWRRVLDGGWRRLSYTALTAQAHGVSVPGAAGALSEPEHTGVDDELGPLDEPGPADPEGATESTGVPCLMGDLPAGAGFGTVVHEVLELVDPASGELAAQLRRLAVQRGARSILATGRDAVREPTLVSERLDTLAAGLELAIRTPLGPLAGGLTLADLPVRDRLCEVEFELPLAGGDLAGDLAGEGAGGSRRPRTGNAANARNAAHLGHVADLLARHLPDDDPLAGYPALLAELADSDADPVLLRGYLTGSLDAVLRVHAPSGPRYLVVDYKTNRLAPTGEPLTVQHYRPPAMAAAMCASHYPLQLLLYLVALHRFLRWRQPGYDPELHLGGGLYLFVRGMCGPETPTAADGTPFGVFGWRPPTAVVVELSALLDGASVSGGSR
ncbi:MAG: UvrD-helicase domain-containing protein [Kineosporiaceae bacterium]